MWISVALLMEFYFLTTKVNILSLKNNTIVKVLKLFKEKYENLKFEV